MNNDYGYTKDELAEELKALVWQYDLEQTIDPRELTRDELYRRSHMLPEVYFNLGVRYYDGNGFAPADRKKAVHLFMMAAEQGHTLAQLNTAMCLMNGDGITQNRREALYWFVKAAGAGDARAIYFIGDYYNAGYDVVEKDQEEAVRFYATSAMQEHPASLYNLGVMLYNGDGFPKDEAAGYRFIKQAAELGFPQAVQAVKKVKDPSGNDTKAQALYEQGVDQYMDGDAARAFMSLLFARRTTAWRRNG